MTVSDQVLQSVALVGCPCLDARVTSSCGSPAWTIHEPDASRTEHLITVRSAGCLLKRLCDLPFAQSIQMTRDPCPAQSLSFRALVWAGTVNGLGCLAFMCDCLLSKDTQSGPERDELAQKLCSYAYHILLRNRLAHILRPVTRWGAHASSSSFWLRKTSLCSGW